MSKTGLEPIATLYDPTCFAINPSQQIEFATRDALPFRHVRNMGQGNSAAIEMVSHEPTNQLFALKTFRRYYGRHFEDFKRAFMNEVSIMLRLSSHTHIIQIRGRYTYDHQLGILLSPAANGGDLGAYIFSLLKSGLTVEHEMILTRAFGCLANGLAYIHKHTIRHKDIKPQNILIHDSRVIYTDFGVSFDADYQNTTTTGCPTAFTQRYCAPEVLDCTSRNRKSDVFSLGCVFVEILDVLKPTNDFRREDKVPYLKKLGELRPRLVQASVTGKVRKGLLRICHDMLEPNQVRRIDTDSVLRQMTRLGNHKANSEIGPFCDDCSVIENCKDEATQEELVDDFTEFSIEPTPNTEIVCLETEVKSTATKAVGERKTKKGTHIVGFGMGKQSAVPQGVFSSKTKRYYCTTCGEMGHSSTDCSNECWACGELYHKSADCPNKCWDCEEVGHFARDCPNKCWTCEEVGHQAKNCPNECDACGQIGHPKEDCPDRCWTCGELGHFARACLDECFVCGRLGHGTQNCVGKCHKCGKIGHWRRDCDDACFECGELGHWATQCPNKKKKGRRGDACYACSASGHRAAQCPKEQREWQLIFDQIPQGPFRPKYRRRN